jgi:hypothetical protein
VRIPDGPNNFKKLMRCAEFFCALLRYSAQISTYGKIVFEQEIFNRQKEFYANHKYRKTNARKTDLFKMLVRQLKPFYEILHLANRPKKKPIEKTEETKLLELLISCVPTEEIKKELNLSSAHQIEKRYKGVCKD